MAINSRAKGIRAEREFRNLIEQIVGVRLRRNQNQTELGGYDLVVDLMECKTPAQRAVAIKLDDYAIEIKNVAGGYQPAHWRQAVQQAEKYKRTPVLAYKVALKGWRVAVLASTFHGSQELSADDLIHCSPETFFKMVGLYHAVKNSERS